MGAPAPGGDEGGMGAPAPGGDEGGMGAEESPAAMGAVGREKRESVDYSRRLGMLLNSKKK